MAETWTLDGLALNDGTVFQIREGEIDLSPPKQKPEWIGAADSEFQDLVRSPLHENRTIVLPLQIVPTATKDLAFDKVGQIVDKLAEASITAGGIALTWTPNGSSRTATFDVLTGEITEFNYDRFMSLSNRARFTITLTCKPYGRLPAMANTTDNFSANTVANYTFDSGGGTVTFNGSTLEPTSTATKRLIHSASTYDVYDCQVTAKITTGTAVPSAMGIFLKRTSANNGISVFVRNAANQLRINKIVAGSETNLTSATGTVSAATSYWVRGRIEGNVVTLELWNSLPTVTGTPASTVSHTLVGSDATDFGAGVPGRAGIRWTPADLNERYDDLTIEPNVFRGSGPELDFPVYGIPGDVRADGELIITDTAAQARRHVEWGLQGPETFDLATSLLIDSEDLVTSGFAGAAEVITGGFDPPSSGTDTAVGATIYSTPQAICGLGNLSHVGSFRVKARVMSTTTEMKTRLAWQVGDGPLSANAWVGTPITHSGSFDVWGEIDYGIVTIPTVAAGTQRWTGRIEAYTPLGGQIEVDYVVLIPVTDGYGKARGTYSYQPGIVTGSDDFTSTTSGSNLNTRVAVTGGTWATSGDATDFQFADDLSGEQLKRSAASGTAGRFAILGSTNLTDTEVSVRFYATAAGATITLAQGVIARWVDASNHLRVRCAQRGALNVVVEQLIAGTATTIATTTTSGSLKTGQWYRVRLLAFASGRVIAQVLDSTDSVIATADGSSTVLATGGTLDDGKPGIIDLNTGAGSSTRYYDQFRSGSPGAEPIVINSGRTLTVSDTDTIRQDTTGVYTGRPPSYRGSRFVMQPGTNRLFVKARRGDVESVADANIADSLQTQVLWTPRVLAVPR